jgi:VanZ family protein
VSDVNANSGTRFQVLSRAALVCYWLLIFTGTHWPTVRLESYPQNTDKILHFLAYSGLGFLMALWLSSKREIGLREMAAIFAIVFVYAIVDEVTQIPVGRDCEFFDAVADWVGCLIGLSAFTILRHTVRRMAAVAGSN